MKFTEDALLEQVFAGATRFANGEPVLFLEMEQGIRVSIGHHTYEGITVVLDAGQEPGEDVPTLTWNLMSKDGHAAAYVKRFPGFLRQEVITWAERNMQPTMNAGDLLGLGFALRGKPVIFLSQRSQR